MQPKKTLSLFLFLVISPILHFPKNLKAMEEPTLVLSYQFGTAGDSPIPTPQSLKDEIQKVLNEHKNEILHLKEELKIQPSSEEKTNFLLALLLILKHEITWGSDKYLRVLFENITEFKDFLSANDLKEILYKLLTYATEINRTDTSNYILKTYESIFKASIFNKHNVSNYQLFKMLLIHQNKEILQNFIQNKILNFTCDLGELKKIAKENQLPDIEKILSKKIWSNRTPTIIGGLILGAFIIISIYLAQTIH